MGEFFDAVAVEVLGAVISSPILFFIAWLFRERIFFSLKPKLALRLVIESSYGDEWVTTDELASFKFSVINDSRRPISEKENITLNLFVPFEDVNSNIDSIFGSHERDIHGSFCRFRYEIKQEIPPGRTYLPHAEVRGIRLAGAKGGSIIFRYFFSAQNYRSKEIVNYDGTGSVCRESLSRFPFVRVTKA